MEKGSKPRANYCYLTLFAILMTAVYILLVSVFVVILYRLVLTQSSAIRILQAKTIELSARFDKFEVSLTAKRDEGKYVVSDTNEDVHGKPTSKMPLNSPQSRNKRQSGGSPYPTSARPAKPHGPSGLPVPPSLFISIHLTGNGKNSRIEVSPIITNWNVQHKTGSIEYDEGKIKVKIAGYYFIYSQMYYFEGNTPQMAHDTYINDRIVMESMESITSNFSLEVHTKYHGGVFQVQANDTISVRVPYTKRYNMDPSKSFFGAFLLHP